LILAVSLTSPIRDAVLPENRQLQNIREHVENIRNDLFDDERIEIEKDTLNIKS
jgi:hypothetical protein